MCIEDCSFKTLDLKLPIYLLSPRIIDISSNKLIIIGGYKNADFKTSKNVYVANLNKGIEMH